MSEPTERVCRMALSAAFEPGRDVLGLAVAEHGAVEVVAMLSSGRVSTSGLAPFAQRWLANQWLAQALREQEECTSRGVTVSIPGDLTWPTQLDDLDERAPLVLRVQGSVDLRTQVARSVAIVGARAATQYGQWVAEEFAAQLAVQGWCVVSGGAFGIDAASHHGALSVGGDSVAVTAAGCDRAVPASHTALYARIYRSGAVVSEVPLGSQPNRHRFLIRNRVIAALVPAVVVVEAAQRSGALATAREALALGRIVGAVPGPVTSAMSAGCHSIIENSGATLITSADDVIQLILQPPSIGGQANDYQPTERQTLLLQLLTSGPKDEYWLVQAVSESTGIGQSAGVAADLFLLERLGFVKRVSNGWVQSRR